MLKRLFYYTLFADLTFLGIGMLFYGVRVWGHPIEVFFSLLILIAALALISFPIAIGLLIAEVVSFYTAGRLREAYRRIPARVKPKKILRRLLSLVLTEEEQETLVGDLLEEYSLFQSKREGRIWVFEQIVKSIPPLVYKNVKERLASYFGAGVR
jgi:hypothetical protein